MDEYLNNNIILSNLGHTWIIDLDGTLVEHNGYKIHGKDQWLTKAREFLLSLPKSDMIIFLTSRKKLDAPATEKFLELSGIRWDHIIYEAPYGERILINDDKPSGLKMAYAINLKRNNGVNVSFEVDETL